MGGPGSGPRLTPEQRERAAERAKTMAALYRAGFTLQQIGDQYGLTRERVRQILTKNFGFNWQSGGHHKKAVDRSARYLAARDQRYLAKCGCTFGDYKAIPRKAKYAFKNQQASARQRGIGWELTLWQWWSFWQASGHWGQRGRGQGFCMCRQGDVGPYALGNVFIAPAIQNSSEKRTKRSDLPLGVRQSGKRFAAHRMINGRLLRLGTFPTPELAHAAYLMAAPQTAHAA